MVQKLLRIAAALSLCLTLSSCNGFDPVLENLMSPPRLTAGQKEIEEALSTARRLSFMTSIRTVTKKRLPFMRPIRTTIPAPACWTATHPGSGTPPVRSRARTRTLISSHLPTYRAAALRIL